MSQEIYVGVGYVGGEDVFDGLLGFFDGLPPSSSCSPFGFDGLFGIFDGLPPSSSDSPFGFDGLLGIFDGLPPSSWGVGLC